MSIETRCWSRRVSRRDHFVLTAALTLKGHQSFPYDSIPHGHQLQRVPHDVVSPHPSRSSTSSSKALTNPSPSLLTASGSVVKLVMK